MKLNTNSLLSTTLLIFPAASSVPQALNGTDPLSLSLSPSTFQEPPRNPHPPRDSSCSRLTEWIFQDDGSHSPTRQCWPAFSLNLTNASSTSSFNISSCLSLADHDIQPMARKYGYWDIYYSCDDSESQLPAILYGPRDGCVFGIRGIEGDRQRDVAMAPADVVGFVRAAVAFAEGKGGGAKSVEGRTRCNGTGKREDEDAEGQTVVWWVGSCGGGGTERLLKESGWLLPLVLGVMGWWQFAMLW